MIQSSKNIVMWLLMIVTVVLIFNFYQKEDTKNIEITYNEFLQDIDKGRISKIFVKQDLVEGEYLDKDGFGKKKFTTHIPENSEMLLERISKMNIDIYIQPKKKDESFLVRFFINVFPILLLIGVWILFMRKMQEVGGTAFGFAKSKERLIEEVETKHTFANVAGSYGSKKELEKTDPVSKNMLIWVLLIFAVFSIFNLYQKQDPKIIEKNIEIETQPK